MVSRALVACVTDTHCRIGLWRGRRLQDVLCVGLDLAGDAQLKAWLAPHVDTVLFILCDVLDERYQLERLPHVGARARRQLLLRKCTAWPAVVGKVSMYWLGQRRGPHIEDTYLLAGISRESPLAAWMERLPLAQWRVRGVYLQALLLPALLPASLTRNTPHGLCLQLCSGRLRLSYLQQGVLCFSRQVAHSGPVGMAQWLAREVEQTRAYLQAQQWVKEADTLHVYMLVTEAADALPNVDDAHALATEASIATIVLPPISPVPARVGVMPTETCVCMQQLLNAYPQLPDLAAPALIARDQRLRIRRMLGMAAISAWLIGSLCCWQEYQQYQQASRRVQQLRQQQAALVAMLPADPLSGTRFQQLQNVLAFVQPLSRAQRSPAQLWRILHRVMPPASVWRVSALQWAYGPAPADAQSVVTSQRTGDTAWAVQVCMTLQANVAVPVTQRHADWQGLMNRLRQQAEIHRIQVLPAASTDGAVLNGQTMSATSRTVYTLRFYLHADTAGQAGA